VHVGGLVTSSQTTASFVGDLREQPIHWATGTSAPCTSLFKPVRVEQPIDLGPVPTNQFDPATLWWRHERLHRATLVDFPRLHPRYRESRDRIEAQWISEPPSSAEAFAVAERIEAEWLESLPTVVEDRRPRWLRRTWRDLDAMAGMDQAGA
jgi:hypothetical protein